MPSAERSAAAGARAARALALLFGLAPAAGWACACGCGVFDVGTLTMLPSRAGTMAYLEDDYMDQDQNWVGAHAAPAAANTDKQIQTHFGSAGIDDQFNGDWGSSLQLPVWDRLYRTDVGTRTAPEVTSFRHSALGDMRLLGRYTGLSSDLSTGIMFGLKLPTGAWNDRGFDRDTAIGTGTTDLLIGAYHLGTLSAEHQLQWFAEGLLDRAFNSRNGYRPGNEVDAAAGVSYGGFRLGRTGALATLLQLIGSDRLHDSGVNADPANSGFRRLLLSPGAEASVGRWKVYGDLEFPLYNYVNAAASVATEGTQGQLIAPVLLKLNVSYHW